jgi:hypothetical protein
VREHLKSGGAAGRKAQSWRLGPLSHFIEFGRIDSLERLPAATTGCVQLSLAGVSQDAER